MFLVSWRLVAIVIRFVGTVDRYADIFRLLLRESGEFYTQFLEVKASDFLVQLLGKDIDAHFLGIPAQVYLCKDLVGEGVGHHK